jgi:UDP-2-acetamido-2-deoxy-ribo-hexuluronate aminotransferase
MDLLLDVNIVLDVCAPRPEFEAAARHAIAFCKSKGHRVWLYVGATQTMECTLFNELKRAALKRGITVPNRQLAAQSKALLNEFASDKQWLAALAGEGNVFNADDPEDEQFLRAIERFPEGQITLLTRDETLLKKAPNRSLTPEQYCQRGSTLSQVQFVDLRAQQDRIRPQLESRIHRVLHHGQYILGPEITELERKLAQFADVKHAITCASGTDALLMPLMAWDIGPGDAVFTTPFTFIATAEVISLLGATPVFVDIDPRTFNIDPELLEKTIKQVKVEKNLRPRAIIPVDLFGLPADYDAFNAIARDHGLQVLEDAAQGLGGSYKGRPAGSLADAAATSFFPAKPLGCYGDGGAIFTDDDELAEKLRSIRVHGKGRDKYDNVRLGLNGRMDTLQVGIVLTKLDIFSDEILARQKVAQRYTERLAECATTPLIPEGCTSAWAQYSILTDHRDALQSILKEHKIPSMVYYPTPLHLQTAYKHLGHKCGDFPISEKTSAQILCLPMHPYLSMETVDGVCGMVLQALGRRAEVRSQRSEVGGQGA